MRRENELEKTREVGEGALDRTYEHGLDLVNVDAVARRVEGPLVRGRSLVRALPSVRGDELVMRLLLVAKGRQSLNRALRRSERERESETRIGSEPGTHE